mmetsp:Transcript_47307/g.86888  ORF Transcript_47307/g.86888 Transcript_47307/m.86888 type:complete len:321 (-) Transcript_47307:43-1005(-)
MRCVSCHIVLHLLWLCLPAIGHGLRLGRNAQSPPTESLQPSLTVMVMSARKTPKVERNVLRDMWQHVDPQHTCMRFAICSVEDVYEKELDAEQNEFGDMLFLRCPEGYSTGALTQKLIASMQHFTSSGDSCMNRDLFMKVDDDTFVSSQNFKHAVNIAWQQHGESIYAGVLCGRTPASRDPLSPRYEPAFVWPESNLPAAMCGGPGYLLGKALVKQILDTGLAEKHTLFNEDRAVSVWIGELQKRGADVAWVSLPGTNGYQWDMRYRTGRWEHFPFALYHHLDSVTIGCLSAMDRQASPAKQVDTCFRTSYGPNFHREWH